MKLLYTKIFLTIISLLIIIFSILAFTGDYVSTSENRQIASRFFLTDLCLTTESRHTRNITLIEPIAPFQDAPGFYDHFPSSTFLQPDSLYFPPKIKINTGF
jgi:hypothetical protein